MSRPADWTPLADADPVPGDLVEVALTGSRLSQVADQINSDVTWLRSLCTAQFWDSGAGQAFQGQVDDAAAKLARAHERYLAAGQALGTSAASPSGYAAALDQAQALSLRARTQGQAAWSAMRAQLAAAEVANKGIVPYQGANLSQTLFTAQPFASDDQRAVPSLKAQVLDVRCGGLGNAQPVECEQGDQGVLGGRPEPGGDQEGAELVVVQGGGVRLVVQPGAADVRGRGVAEEFFLDGVPVEPGDGAQPLGHGRAGTAAGLEFAANVSISARRTENSGRDRVRHQPVNWRRSRM